MPYRFVIVGSGIAALSAAEAIRTYDAFSEIVLISEEPHEFYSRPGLAYFLRGDFPERQLVIRNRQQIETLRLHRVTGRVLSIDRVHHELTLAHGERWRYDRLLLATGALAAPPPFPGGELDGVVKLDGLDDARHILERVRRGRPAVVVGGGITALELAEALNARRMKVQFFLRGQRYWSDVLDETESLMVMDRLRNEGIVIRTQTQVKQALGRGGRLEAVETTTGEVVPCQVLAVAIGVRPRTELAKNAGLCVGKGITVNEYLTTSDPDIFAAGDVAEVTNPRTGVAALDVLWPSALAQGKAAGANMAGQVTPYIKEVPFNVTLLAGLRTAIIGNVGGGANEDLVAITRGESEEWRILPRSWFVENQDGTSRLRLVVGERTLLGAIIMGDQSWTRPLRQMIMGRVDIGPVRPHLLANQGTALAHLAEWHRRWQALQAQRPAGLPPNY